MLLGLRVWGVIRKYPLTETATLDRTGWLVLRRWFAWENSEMMA